MYQRAPSRYLMGEDTSDWGDETLSVIDIKMSAIYQAAHEVLPGKADDFRREGGIVTAAIEPMVAETALAGNHPIGGDLADVAVELFWHMREMVRTFNSTATALDCIADDFVAVNDEAASWFEDHTEYLGDPDTATEPTAPEV